MRVKKLPDFIVIGASKSGTTSMYWLLKGHPEIFMPNIKEINYFAYHNDIRYRTLGGGYEIKRFNATTLEEYTDYFSPMRDEKVAGEASPIYLSSEIAATQIKRTIPNAKLIASLRNPVESAISAYFMFVRLGKESRTLEEAFRHPENEYYALAGRYNIYLSRYFEQFDSNQIHIMLFEDFKKDTPSKMQEIYGFIGVDSNYVSKIERIHKKGGIPRGKTGKAVQDVYSRISKSSIGSLARILLPQSIRQQIRNTVNEKMLHYPAVEPNITARLREFFARDIEDLSKMIGRDLSAWLE